MCGPRYPEGYPVDEVPETAALIRVEDLDIPSDHEHFLLIFRNVYDEDRLEKGAELLKVLDVLKQASGGEVDPRLAKQMEGIREIQEQGHGYEVVAFCERNGATSLDILPTYDGALDAVDHVRETLDGASKQPPAPSRSEAQRALESSRALGGKPIRG